MGNRFFLLLIFIFCDHWWYVNFWNLHVIIEKCVGSSEKNKRWLCDFIILVEKLFFQNKLGCFIEKYILQ